MTNPSLQRPLVEHDGTAGTKWTRLEPDERSYQSASIPCSCRCRWWSSSLRREIREKSISHYCFRMISSASDEIPSTISAYCSTFFDSNLLFPFPFAFQLKSAEGNRKRKRKMI
jgi:hypothetical protein